jgi:hypothetical protein
MSAAGPPQGARPLGGAARSAVRGEPMSAAGPPQGARPPGGAARSAVRGEPMSAAGMYEGLPAVCGFAGGRMHHPKPAANLPTMGDEDTGVGSVR